MRTARHRDRARGRISSTPGASERGMAWLAGVARRRGRADERAPRLRTWCRDHQVQDAQSLEQVPASPEVAVRVNNVPRADLLFYTLRTAPHRPPMGPRCFRPRNSLSAATHGRSDGSWGRAEARHASYGKRVPVGCQADAPSPLRPPPRHPKLVGFQPVDCPC